MKTNLKKSKKLKHQTKIQLSQELNLKNLLKNKSSKIEEIVDEETTKFEEEEKVNAVESCEREWAEEAAVVYERVVAEAAARTAEL